MASTRKGDDDDNVSVTSTAASEEREEYLVDRIVGERENEGTTEYLVMWEGYPDYRCTWEPENNFNDGVILPTWNHTKLRVKRGLEQPFNVTALEQKIRDWEEATALRKHLRREKRKRIGLPVAESEEDEEEAQDEDSHEQQAQILTEETLHSPHPRQEAEKQSESDTVEYSSDEDDNVLPMHRTDSIASQSISSDEDRPVLRKKGIARKLSYQGTQQPSKTARENPKGAHETHEKLLTAALRASHDDISQQEQRKRQENTTQMKNASKPALGHAKPRGDLTSRRTSIETSLKKSSKPQPTNPHFVRSEPLNPVEISDTPKKRGRPVGWRKHPTPSDSTSKEPQQPRVGVKTAPSFTKRKVTGSVISKNWNKPIPKKRLSFATSSHVTDNPGITNAKNQNRFRNLATQHKFAKASRNEPPPRMQDLVLYNAKDGPPKPGVKHLTPFQMIQAKMAAEASGSAGQTIEKERKVSFGDIEESPDDANPTSPEIPQPSAPPLTIETRKSVSFLEQEGKSDSPNVHSTGLRKTVMFADVEDMVASPVNVSVGNGVKKTPTESDHVLNSPVELSHETSSITNPQSAAIIEEPQEKYGDEVDGDPMDLSPDYSPPENMAVDTTRHTLSDAQRLINSWGFQNPPSTRPDPLERSVTNGSRRSRPNVKYESGKEPPGDLATVKASPLSEEVGEKDSCEPSIYSLQDARHGKSDVTSTSSGWYDPSNTEEVPPVLSWSQTQGNVGQHTFGCHVYGTIFRGEYFAMKCAFKGLPYLSKTLFLSIKVPPKDVNVKIRHTLTPENYKRYFHTDKPLYFGAGHVHVLEYRQEAADELAEELKSHGLGGLYFAKEFSLLFYPTGTDEWSFLDAHFVKEAQLPVSLRFVMFLPIPEFFGLRAIETPVGDSPIGLLEGEPAINRLFREAYQIDYKKLVIDDNKSEYIHEDTFFIMYPPFKKDEHDLLVSFLEANRATVYSSYTPGAWDYVLKEANHAIILATLHTIPSLYRAALTTRSFFHPIFHITLDLSFAPPELDTPQCLTRLFPSGGAILFTDSFIITQPQEALRVLNWLVLRIFPNKSPGSWKLALRPRFRDWLLKVVQSLDPPKGDPFMEIYAVLYKLLPLSLMEEDTDFETPKPEAPVVTPRYLSGFDHSVSRGVLPNEREVMRRNDERLVDWYAGWARTKVYSMRRLHVVYSDQLFDKEQIKKPWKRKWNHLAFWTAEECLREHDIERWEKEKKAADELVRDKRERKEKKIAEWEREKREKKRGLVETEVREVHA